MSAAAKRWHGPPLAVQIMLLLLGVLVVAQLVTLALTLLLPPAPQPQYQLDDIARLLGGSDVTQHDQRLLQRLVQLQPPDPAGPGWLTSDASRSDLARLLGVQGDQVRLYFYTPLPFAGAASPLPQQRVFRDVAGAPQRPAVVGQNAAATVVPERWLARVSQPVGGQGAGPAAGLGRGGVPGGNALPDVGANGANGGNGANNIGGLVPRPPVRLPQPQVTATLPTMTVPPVTLGVPTAAMPGLRPVTGTDGNTGAPRIPLLLPPAAALTPIRPPAGAERMARAADVDTNVAPADAQAAVAVHPLAAAISATDHRMARAEESSRITPSQSQEPTLAQLARQGPATWAHEMEAMPLAGRGTTQAATAKPNGQGTDIPRPGASTTPSPSTSPAPASLAGAAAAAAAAAPVIAAALPSALAVALTPGSASKAPLVDANLHGRITSAKPLVASPAAALQTPPAPPQPTLRIADAQPQAATPAMPDATATLQPASERPTATTTPTAARLPPTTTGMDTVRGLLGLAPAPFVVGDFIAGVQLATGGWAVVQPTPEPFPNAWQRRVLLWFAVALLLVAPLAWVFSRRLVLPITGFARAAEQLGRDPSATISPLDGPAEVGRAAHAFNTMQHRLRSFIDDRTTMIGAISHDLRTPLTRMRFRIEDAPDELRDGMLDDVQEMEAMINSVLAFIRDASDPGAREVLDLLGIVEDVVEDAVFVGKQVVLEPSEGARVEVDAIAMRRLLSNLIDNAVKYGDRAEVRLFTDRQYAIAEVSDHGKGLPDDELERVFQPFYRAPDALASAKSGSGLGLAVCRSIARAHGGDVNVKVGNHGLVAQVRLPLSPVAPAGVRPGLEALPQRPGGVRGMKDWLRPVALAAAPFSAGTVRSTGG